MQAFPSLVHSSPSPMRLFREWVAHPYYTSNEAICGNDNPRRGGGWAVRGGDACIAPCHFLLTALPCHSCARALSPYTYQSPALLPADQAPRYTSGTLRVPPPGTSTPACS